MSNQLPTQILAPKQKSRQSYALPKLGSQSRIIGRSSNTISKSGASSCRMMHSTISKDKTGGTRTQNAILLASLGTRTRDCVKENGSVKNSTRPHQTFMAPLPRLHYQWNPIISSTWHESTKTAPGVTHETMIQNRPSTTKQATQPASKNHDELTNSDSLAKIRMEWHEHQKKLTELVNGSLGRPDDPATFQNFAQIQSKIQSMARISKTLVTQQLSFTYPDPL